jgi:hypothetical protein
VVNDQGAMVCVDEEAMNKQKGVLVSVMKQLTVNFFKGVPISHISLPVKIFETRSMVQRIVDLFAFVPRYIIEAAKSEDHLERLKNVIAMSISSTYLCFN